MSRPCLPIGIAFACGSWRTENGLLQLGETSWGRSRETGRLRAGARGADLTGPLGEGDPAFSVELAWQTCIFGFHGGSRRKYLMGMLFELGLMEMIRESCSKW